MTIRQSAKEQRIEDWPTPPKDKRRPAGTFVAILLVEGKWRNNLRYRRRVPIQVAPTPVGSFSLAGEARTATRVDPTIPAVDHLIRNGRRPHLHWQEQCRRPSASRGRRPSTESEDAIPARFLPTFAICHTPSQGCYWPIRRTRALTPPAALRTPAGRE